jgi:hypothetical protein
MYAVKQADAIIQLTDEAPDMTAFPDCACVQLTDEEAIVALTQWRAGLQAADAALASYAIGGRGRRRSKALRATDALLRSLTR